MVIRTSWPETVAPSKTRVAVKAFPRSVIIASGSVRAHLGIQVDAVLLESFRRESNLIVEMGAFQFPAAAEQMMQVAGVHTEAPHDVGGVGKSRND